MVLVKNQFLQLIQKKILNDIMIELYDPKTIIGEIVNIGKKICILKPTRQLSNVFLSLSEEIGELATEISVRVKSSSKISGEDGIKGEAVDVILCALDILHLEGCEEDEIIELMRQKGAKWLRNKAKQV